MLDPVPLFFVCIVQVPIEQPASKLKSTVRHHWAVADDLSRTAEEYKIRVPHPVTEVCTMQARTYMLCDHGDLFVYV